MQPQGHHLPDVRTVSTDAKTGTAEEGYAAALASEAVRDLVFSFLRIEGQAMRQAALGAVRAMESASRSLR